MFPSLNFSLTFFWILVVLEYDLNSSVLCDLQCFDSHSICRLEKKKFFFFLENFLMDFGVKSFSRCVVTNCNGCTSMPDFGVC